MTEPTVPAPPETTDPTQILLWIASALAFLAGGTELVLALLGECLPGLLAALGVASLAVGGITLYASLQKPKPVEPQTDPVG